MKVAIPTHRCKIDAQCNRCSVHVVWNSQETLCRKNYTYWQTHENQEVNQMIRNKRILNHLVCLSCQDKLITIQK